MNDPRDDRDARMDRQLSELLSDAVCDVEPGNALDSIRTRTKVTPMSTRRPWLFAVGGAVVATAAVITAIALAGGSLPGTTADPGPAGNTSTAPADPSPSTAPDPTGHSDEPTPSAPGAAIPVYFLGDTPQGPRLYREFQRSSEAGDQISKAVDLAVSGQPLDPDYRTSWPDGARAYASYDGDLITVTLETADAGGPELGLHDRPAGMSEAEASMAVEQVIYTVQAALQKGRPPVQFLINGERTDQVLGVPTSEPLANGPVLQTLAHVSLTTPVEGQTVPGDVLEVSGVANSFEANVVVRLQRFEGTEILVEEPFTAEGWMGEKLFPFAGELDLSDVPPGTYLLVASTDDPSGGEEGFGPHTDSRTIVVE